MKPIIFSAPMVRALLSGRKTQSRRPADIDLAGEPGEEIVMRGDSGCSNHIPGVGYGSIVECPYGGPGDRLYVREGIRLAARDPDVASYVADGSQVPFLDAWPWKSRQLSPIHMPRGVRRIELELLEVRIEPLQSISKEDAIAEGAFRGNEERNRAHWTMDDRATAPDQCLGSPQMALANLYNVLHGGPNWNLKPGPSPFDANPFVWVLRFAVHDMRKEMSRSEEGPADGRSESDSLSGAQGGPP